RSTSRVVRRRVTERRAMPSKKADPMEEMSNKLPGGWLMYHAQEPQSVQAAGGAIQFKPGSFIAHKRGGGTRIEQQADSLDELVTKLLEYEATKVVPNPLTEDGNRVLSDEEKLNNAAATASMDVSQAARSAVTVDLTPVGEAPQPKSATVKVGPV